MSRTILFNLLRVSLTLSLAVLGSAMLFQAEICEAQSHTQKQAIDSVQYNDSTGSKNSVPDSDAGIRRALPSKRSEHLAPRGYSQHTFFANAAYTTVLSTLYLSRSSSGSLNEGYDLSFGYNWTSRKGLGAGIIYSYGNISAERNGIERTSRFHYIAPEFVARQRAGRRWLFRESAGIGYGRYIRSYGDLSGSKGGVGIHESASVEFMLGRHIGLSAGFSGQWLIVDSPDVDDGGELNLLGGIFRFQLGGGLRFYF